MKRLTLIPILTVLLVGCGGGGGSGPGSGSTPPPTQQSFAGMWTGTDSNGVPITAYLSAIGRSYPLTKGLTGLNRISASFSKADVRNVGIGVELNVRFWPKADVR